MDKKTLKAALRHERKINKELTATNLERRLSCNKLKAKLKNKFDESVYVAREASASSLIIEMRNEIDSLDQAIASKNEEVEAMKEKLRKPYVKSYPKTIKVVSLETGAENAELKAENTELLEWLNALHVMV